MLVVQNRTERRYDEDEVEDIQTIAMVLAETVSSGELLDQEELRDVELAQIAGRTVGGIVQALGINVHRALQLKPGKRCTTVLRQLLSLVGAKLEARRVRLGPGRGAERAYVYRVVIIPLPDGIEAPQLVAAWLESIRAGRSGVPKSALKR